MLLEDGETLILYMGGFSEAWDGMFKCGKSEILWAVYKFLPPAII